MKENRQLRVETLEDRTMPSTGLSSPALLPQSPSPTAYIVPALVAEGNEGTTTVQVTLRLTEPTDKPVTVEIATYDLTAKAGLDYFPAHRVRVFAPGQVRATFTVRVVGDRQV